jgi:hypothetical protein
VSWAFSDESERADRMLFGTLFVEAQHTYELRKQLRSLLLPGQRRIHMTKEGVRRRRVILDAIVHLEPQVTVLELRRPNGVTRPEARAMLLSVASGVVAERSTRFWVLDNIEESQMRRDELQLHGAGVEALFDHRPSHEEPLLWVVDVALWAYGAGGEWKRRSAPIVDVRRIAP